MNTWGHRAGNKQQKLCAGRRLTLRLSDLAIQLLGFFLCTRLPLTAISITA
jgi:hypothetical protein